MHVPPQDRNVEWYRVQFSDSPTHGAMPFMPTMAPPQRGLSVQWMWIITLLVIIGLFACCVFLALTSEIRFTAG